MGRLSCSHCLPARDKTCLLATAVPMPYWRPTPLSFLLEPTARSRCSLSCCCCNRWAWCAAMASRSARLRWTLRTVTSSIGWGASLRMRHISHCEYTISAPTAMPTQPVKRELRRTNVLLAPRGGFWKSAIVERAGAALWSTPSERMFLSLCRWLGPPQCQRLIHAERRQCSNSCKTACGCQSSADGRGEVESCEWV